MQTLEPRKKDIVDFFLKKRLLINSELLNYLEDENNFGDFTKVIERLESSKEIRSIAVLSDKIKSLILDSQENTLNWVEIEKLSAKSEKKNILDDGSLHDRILQENGSSKETDNKVKIIFSYNKTPKKREASDFVLYFNNRYYAVERILKHRQEMQSNLSISRIAGKKDREQVSTIGMVKDKQYTKNGNCMLSIEDMTGEINVLVNKNKPELFNKAKNIVLDEVLGVAGVNGSGIIFASNIIHPDIPVAGDIKKCKEEVYALFLSDTHIGSNNFLVEDFNNFLKWINCDFGSKAQRDTASKVKYIFIIGDLVDGCGVYPGQEKELQIKDIKDQYKACAELLGKIPSHISIIISPGNHDAMRLAEPQLPIYKDFGGALYSLPNAVMVSNPAMVNIHSSANFEGFDVLLYHGYSFDYYISEVEPIRNNGGYDRIDLLMKFLLQKRHLAPSYTSTPYVPDITQDCLVIDKVPDFFVSGHVHKAAAANYKNTTLICGSCWQSKTAYQEKVGHIPEPSRVPLVNLQTRQIKMLKFGGDT